MTSRPGRAPSHRTLRVWHSSQALATFCLLTGRPWVLARSGDPVDSMFDPAWVFSEDIKTIGLGRDCAEEVGSALTPNCFSASDVLVTEFWISEASG